MLHRVGVDREAAVLGGQGEVDLRDALRLMETTYDAAGGTGSSVADLRSLAAAPAGFVEVVLDPIDGADPSLDWAGDAGLSPPSALEGCGSRDVETGLGSSDSCPFSDDAGNPGTTAGETR